MHFSYPVKFLVVLFLVSFAKGQFNAYCDWFLFRDSGTSPITSIENRKNGGVPTLSANDGSDLRSSIGCSSMTVNKETWKLTTDFSSLISGSANFAVGFWVYFESTIGSEFFVFGSPTGISFRVSSSTEQELLLKAYSASTTTDPVDDLSVTVPLSNFHIEKFIFLVFNFEDDNAGHVEIKVLVPDHDVYTKKTAGSGFSLPQGILSFGNDIKARFHQVIVGKKAEFSGDFFTVNFYDSSSYDMVVMECGQGCSGSQCSPEGFCFDKDMECSTCSGGSCSACTDPGLDPSASCLSCKAGHTVKSGRCCADANNCDTCSTSDTICDSCPADYFLYKASASSTSCIACADSCTNCHPGPNCYLCAESIVQSGNTCEIKQVGYEISFDTKNIVIDFAYPLSTPLSKNSFKAATVGDTPIPIPTDGWTFTGCIKGSVQCIIETDLQESDTPFVVDFAFDQA